MKLFTRGRVVKSYDVEVTNPRMVECTEGFQQLETYLTVLTLNETGTPSPVSGEEVNEPIFPSFDGAIGSESSDVISLDQVRAKQTMKEAQEKADALIAQAEVEAQAIRAQAESEVEQLRQAVAEGVRAEVFPLAQAEGYQAGFQAGEAEVKRRTHEANQLFHLAQRAVQEEYAKVDETLLQLALKIAERLVRGTLAVQPERLLTMIQALMLLPQERSGWRLHVAPEDAQWLEQLPEGQQPACEWVYDETLNPGDCFLECEEGIFDARLEAQLEKLEHTLREELEHGGVESTGSDSGTN